jgi:hypothetical protein
MHRKPVVGDFEIPPVGKVEVKYPLVQKIGMLRPPRGREGRDLKIFEHCPCLVAGELEAAEMQ